MYRLHRRLSRFQGRVYELIDEAETMENLGIVLPAEVRTLLAKKNGLLDDIMNVNNLVDAYDSFVSRMDDVEVSRVTGGWGLYVSSQGGG